ncbi:MAG: hypothetical protein D6714_11245, partial [Bacteroidetes bacterium]
SDPLFTQNSTWGQRLFQYQTQLRRPHFATTPDKVPYPAATDVAEQSHTPPVAPLAQSLTGEPPFRILGAKAGITLGKTFIPDRELTAVSGTHVGLKTEFLFARKLSMVTGLDFHFLKYQTSAPHFGTGEIPLPEDPVFDPADLVFVQSDQYFTQLKIGLKYTFGEENVRPYIGLSYLSAFRFKKQFYYLFDPAKYTLPEWETTRQHTEFTATGGGLDVGLEYQPRERLLFQFEAFYQFSNRKPNSLFHNLLGVRTAALYRF